MTSPMIGSGTRPVLSLVFWCAAARSKISSRSLASASLTRRLVLVEQVGAGGAVLHLSDAATGAADSHVEFAGALVHLRRDLGRGRQGVELLAERVDPAAGLDSWASRPR
jgi:hypothetical protein